MSFPIISSNTLFHFTSKREHLINILTNNFRARFCLENFKCLLPDFKHSVFLAEFAFPMSCFCDIPLSNIQKHLKIYGNYGIGLKKDWGKKNGLNPILYVHKNSSLLESIYNLGVGITQDLKEKVNLLEFPEILRNLTTVQFHYIKPYEGNFERNGEIIPNVRFYDEREWRYIPKPPDESYYGLTKEDFMNLEMRQSSNDLVAEWAILEFTPDDIRYIVVDRENEISEMVDEVMLIKGDKYTHNQLKVLTTRIISAEQIREDF